MLKPGGRLMVSDIVLLRELPEAVKNSIEARVECQAGAAMKVDYINAVQETGFQDIKIMDERSFTIKDLAGHPEVQFSMKISGENLPISFASITVSAIKRKTGKQRVP